MLDLDNIIERADKYGIPKTSYGPNDSPSLENGTWFSLLGDPPHKAPEGKGWVFNLDEGWSLTELNKNNV